MSTFLIDSTLQNIVFNGYDVQRLIYNSNLVWEKGSGPTPPTPTPLDLIDPYEDIYYREKSSQYNSWDYGCTSSYNQYNFIDVSLCTVDELADNDYGNARIIILRGDSSKTVVNLDHIKICEWLTDVQATSLYDAIDNASDPLTWSSTIESVIREWYKGQRTTASSWYYTQIWDAWYATGCEKIYDDGSQANFMLTNSAGTKYNIDDTTSSPLLQYTYKVKLLYDVASNTTSYYPGLLDNRITNVNDAPYIYLSDWTNLFKMLYNEYYLKYATGIKYTITVSSSDLTKGTASGGGEKFEGKHCTVTATTTSSAYTFSGWYENGTLVSNDAEYTFTVTGNRTLEARFTDSIQYFIAAAWVPSGSGVATGGGFYYVGDTATLTAVKNTGYKFVGWYDINNTLVSTNNPYIFTVTDNLQIWAHFEESQSAYTEVACLKADSTGYGFRTLYFNTGIYTSDFNKLEIEVNYMPLTNNGDVFFGHTGTDITSGSYEDSKDCRLFYYSNSVYVDVGSSRRMTSDGFNTYKNYKWTINKTTNKWSLYNITNESYKISEETLSGTINNQPIYICPSPMKFKSIIIKKDDTTVFNGISVLDNNDVPCIYDSISDNFFYAQGTNASRLTYEALS